MTVPLNARRIEGPQYNMSYSKKGELQFWRAQIGNSSD